MDSQLDPALSVTQRLIALAGSALDEVAAAIEIAGLRLGPIPLFLGLAERRPGLNEPEAAAVCSALGSYRRPGLFSLAKVRGFPLGHAAGLVAFTAAAHALRSGSIDACLVGGVDSYFDPDTMEWLDANRQLVGTTSRSGFVPGEGAAMCLLMSEPVWARVRIPSLGRMVSAAIGNEAHLIKTRETCLGEGLTAAVREALAILQPQRDRVNNIFCDMNGEGYRGEEWGFVCLKLSALFDDPTAYCSPAENWGDVGAASGPLFAMLACQAHALGYASGPRTLVWASSEGGQRGAVCLEAAFS
jgi:3-oxoacyl-[acyl-carrier-protein] synthase-1